MKTKQFYDQVMQKLVKTGKNTAINKQSDVKFWLNWIKYGAVSYSLSCNNSLILCSKYYKVKGQSFFRLCNQNQIKPSKPRKTIQIVCYEIEK